MRTRAVLELVGCFALVVAVSTCGILGPPGASRTVAVVEHPDGTVTVTEAAPWWGPLAASALSGIAALAGGLYLYTRDPRDIRRRSEPS